MTMRKLVIVACLCVAACNDQRTPQSGVDTSPVAGEGPAKGTITGELSFPSDYIPDDLDVCAESLDGKTRHCGAEKSESTYSLAIPPGAYRVFAYLKSDPKNRAYYSEFVRCGSGLECPSHAPITVTVREDETTGQVNPGDWYANLEGGDSADPEDVEDPFYDPEPEPQADEEVETSEPSPSVEATRAQPRGSVVSLFSTDDYPQSAIRNEEEGTTGVRLFIGADGRVWNCEVVSSSGSVALDSATCSIIRRRARFTPARDAQGNAVPDSYVQRITWTLGD